MTDLDAVIDHLRPLIALDTTSHRSNLALIELVADWLAAAGIAAHVLFDATGTKAGLLASVGPARRGGIVLSGHTDTVPVDGQLWRSNPFTLVQRDDRLFGRGTADMKGFIAAVLAMLPGLARAPLKVPIHLLLSYDEEVGCLAAPELVAALQQRLPPPALAIVGEPSEMRVATAHRGIATYTTTVHGRAGHSGLPASGTSAIVAAARCITWLDALAGSLAPADADDVDDAAGPAVDGDVAATLATTLNVGVIEGGSAVNIIPPECRLEWECRPAPGFAIATVEDHFEAFVATEVLPAMQHRTPEAKVDTVRRVLVPPLTPPATGEARALAATVLAWAQRRSPTTVPFASEAGFLQMAGMPAFICGPGSPRQAHQADEYVSTRQIQACITFLQHLGAWAQQSDAERQPPLASAAQVS